MKTSTIYCVIRWIRSLWPFFHQHPPSPGGRFYQAPKGLHMDRELHRVKTTCGRFQRADVGRSTPRGGKRPSERRRFGFLGGIHSVWLEIFIFFPYILREIGSLEMELVPLLQWVIAFSNKRTRSPFGALRSGLPWVESSRKRCSLWEHPGSLRGAEGFSDFFWFLNVMDF